MTTVMGFVELKAGWDELVLLSSFALNDPVDLRPCHVQAILCPLVPGTQNS